MDCTRNHKDGRECVCVVCVTQNKEVEGSRSDTKQDILRKKRGVQALEQAVENINLSAEKAVERSDEIFNDLIRHMEKRSSDLKQKVRAEQEFKVSRVKALQEKLEQEISELKKHAQELDALQEEYSSEPPHGSAGPTSSHMCPLRFVEDVKATVSSEPLHGSAGPTSSHMCPLRVVEDVKATVSDTKDKPLCGLKPRDVPADCRTNRLKPPVPQTQADDPSVATEPKSRAEFLRYARDVTLDPNTVNAQLLLSEGNRKATLTMREEQTYPRHADRFVRWRQVLSAESLSGRCYWEVEWRKKRVNLAVSYRSIGRAGSMNECAFGFNNKSWLLECNCSSSYKFIHNGVKTLISGPRSSRVGVYLDHTAGILSFYSISETMTLLHRVQTTFTQPLHAGLWFSGYNGASAEFCKLT